MVNFLSHIDIGENPDGFLDRYHELFMVLINTVNWYDEMHNFLTESFFLDHYN